MSLTKSVSDQLTCTFHHVAEPAFEGASGHASAGASKG